MREWVKNTFHNKTESSQIWIMQLSEEEIESEEDHLGRMRELVETKHPTKLKYNYVSVLKYSCFTFSVLAYTC